MEAVAQQAPLLQVKINQAGYGKEQKEIQEHSVFRKGR